MAASELPLARSGLDHVAHDLAPQVWRNRGVSVGKCSRITAPPLLKIRARVGPVLMDDARVRDLQIEGWHAEVERVYREHGERLWRTVLLFSRDRDVASDAVAEAFTQALGRGGEIRALPGWVWRTAFRVAAGELKAR